MISRHVAREVWAEYGKGCFRKEGKTVAEQNPDSRQKPAQIRLS